MIQKQHMHILNGLFLNIGHAEHSEASSASIGKDTQGAMSNQDPCRV